MKRFLIVLLIVLMSSSAAQAGTGTIKWGFGFWCKVDSNGEFICTCIRTNPAGRVPGKSGKKKGGKK